MPPRGPMMTYPPAPRPSAPWAADLGPYASDQPPGVSPADVTLALAVATNLLWALSGRQFNHGSVVVRPCKGSWLANFFPAAVIASLLPPFGGGFGWLGGLGSGLLFGQSWLGTCADTIDGCGCGTHVDRIELRPFPIIGVSAVKVDGVTLNPSLYKILNYRYLIRTDGNLWPNCQDLTQEDTAVGTWSVAYTFGKTIPVDAVLAAQEFALEILKAQKGQPCGLNRRATQVARQGVQVALWDPNTMLDKGRTGLWLADSFIVAHNPGRLQRPTRVYRADDRSGRSVRET